MEMVNIEEENLHIFWNELSQIDPIRFRVKWISEKNNDYILRLVLSVIWMNVYLDWL